MAGREARRKVERMNGLVMPDDMRDVVIILRDGAKAYGWWADDAPCGWRKYDNAYPVGNVDELQSWVHIQDNDDVIGWHEMNSSELTDTLAALRAEVARLTAQLSGKAGELQQARERWIPVKERPPENGLRVICYSSGAGCVMALFLDGLFKSDYDGYAWRSISHWRPRPTPPEQEANG